MIRAAINGYGRIGRNILRALYESGYREHIKIVAINDLGDAKLNAHLTQFDSVHGRFNAEVSADEKSMTINGDNILMLAEKQPIALPWQALSVDVVFECTGLFTQRQAAQAHIDAGANKVLISAPGTDVDATVVYGVNHQVLNNQHHIVSNASCTTNCLAPLAKVLSDTVGIEQGSMTTVHAYTNDQQITDSAHSDWYRARSATQSMIPTKTGAAKAVGLVLPELAGKIDGMAIRVPLVNVSLIDFNFLASRETTAKEINSLVQQAAKHSLKSVLTYSEQPLVSVDFNHQPASSNFDATQTKVYDRWVKVMAWYDNEWGFSNRMLDTGLAMGSQLKH